MTSLVTDVLRQHICIYVTIVFHSAIQNYICPFSELPEVKYMYLPGNDKQYTCIILIGDYMAKIPWTLVAKIFWQQSKKG